MMGVGISRKSADGRITNVEVVIWIAMMKNETGVGHERYVNPITYG